MVGSGSRIATVPIQAPAIDKESSRDEDIDCAYDVPPRKESKITRVLLRGSEKTAIVIDPALVKGRGWNRFEGTPCGEKLTLRLNGRERFKDRPVAGASARGPIRIVPTGGVDFANVYVRKLKDTPRKP